MSRTSSLLIAALALGACSHAEFAVRPVPKIVADNVGQPVSRLEEAFGAPRKVDSAGIKQVYVWFIPMQPTGAPAGFHGCEMEVTVDTRSQRVMGYSLSNIGWSNCREAQKRIRVASL